MICPNCGTQNVDNSKFCIRCGKNMSDVVMNQNNFSMNNSQQQTSTVESSFSDFNSQPTVVQEPIKQSLNQQVNITTNNSTNNIKMSFSNYLFIILAVILKPFTAFKEELNKFNEFKNSAFLSLIVSVLATLIALVKTMFNTVRVTSYWTDETKWVWENLKEINYIKVIGINFLIYAGIILALACVYYIGSLIVKKQINFARLLGISSASVVPTLICSLILSPLLAMIYIPLGMCILIIGGVYTIIIIYETINNEIMLEGNVKYYFNLICLSILSIAAYYLYMKVFMSSVSGGLDIF